MCCCAAVQWEMATGMRAFASEAQALFTAAAPNHSRVHGLGLHIWLQAQCIGAASCSTQQFNQLTESSTKVVIWVRQPVAVPGTHSPNTV